MNAFNNINLSAALILTSVDFAHELGVPEEKLIYPLGGAGTKDSDECEEIHMHAARRLERSTDKQRSLAAPTLHLQSVDCTLYRRSIASVQHTQRVNRSLRLLLVRVALPFKAQRSTN